MTMWLHCCKQGSFSTVTVQKSLDVIALAWALLALWSTKVMFFKRRIISLDLSPSSSPQLLGRRHKFESVLCQEGQQENWQIVLPCVQILLRHAKFPAIHHFSGHCAIAELWNSRQQRRKRESSANHYSTQLKPCKYALNSAHTLKTHQEWNNVYVQYIFLYICYISTQNRTGKNLCKANSHKLPPNQAVSTSVKP